MICRTFLKKLNTPTNLMFQVMSLSECGTSYTHTPSQSSCTLAAFIQNLEC